MTTSASLFRALLILFGLSMCVSISATEIGAGILLVWWIVDLARTRGASWRATPLNKPLLIFYAWGILCVAVVRPYDIGTAIAAPSALALFYWASQRLERGEIESLLKWMCIGGAVVGLLGIVQSATGINYVERIHGYEMTSDRFRSFPHWFLHLFSLHNNRAMGSRSHPLTYSECLIPIFFLLMNAGVRACREPERSWKKITVATLGWIFVAGGILASQSRGVWIGLIIGFAVYSVFMGRRFLAAAVAAGAVLAAVLFTAAPASVKGRLFSVVSSQAGTVGDQWSKQTRYEIWKQAWAQTKQHPLMGVGFDGVALTVQQPMDPAPRIWTETHNLYLQALLETGFIGFGMLLWILFITARLLWVKPVSLRFAFLGMYAAFLVAGLTESWTHDKEVAMIFWLLIGCAASL